MVDSSTIRPDAPKVRQPGRTHHAFTGVLVSAVLTIVAVVGFSTRGAVSHVAHGTLPRTAFGRPDITPRRARSAVGQSSSTSTSRSTTTTTTPTTLAAAAVAAPPVEDTTLLSPEDVPGAGTTRPIGMVGRIQIPKIGLDSELRDQITQESIDLGPSHWPGTAMPGGYGNAVVAGHRNSHTAPFYDAANLRAGDPITLVVADGRAFTYLVTEMFVVDPSAIWITEQKPGHTLTLFTCNPIGSSAQRLVIRAQLA